jgi:DNA-binding CsgD family transcriptional regulator
VAVTRDRLENVAIDQLHAMAQSIPIERRTCSSDYLRPIEQYVVCARRGCQQAHQHSALAGAHIHYSLTLRDVVLGHDPFARWPTARSWPQRSPFFARLSGEILPQGSTQHVHDRRLTAAYCLAQLLEPARPADLAPLLARGYRLSARERAVAVQLLLGRSTAQIAAALDITPYTVRDHLKAIFAKVGVRSRRELGQVLAARTGSLAED